MELSFEELKQMAQLANVALIPALWILWKIDRKLLTLSITTEAHQKEDNLRFSNQENRLNEIHERMGDLEERVNNVAG